MNKNKLPELKENAKHGDYILPFTIYEGNISENYSSIPIHWHDEIEFTIIRSGSAEYKIDLNSYIAKKNDIIIIPSGMLHSINKLPLYDMEWSTMVFHIKMLNSGNIDGCLLKYLSPLISNLHELPLIIKENHVGYNDILNTMNKIFITYNDKELAYELELKSLLFHLFSLFYKYNLVKENNKNNVINSSAINKIKLILNYIEKHYNKNITITQLSNLCGYSDYHFMRFFKKHVGISCIQYINNLRLENASNLLTSTNKSILDICLEVGFDNLSYFNKLFKRKFNTTPKKFRLNK